jgi:ribosomal-protein-alanine N-acetyltransferase
MKLETLESNRIKIRQLSIVDVDNVYGFTSMEEVTEFLSWAPHKYRNITASFLEDVISPYKDATKASQWGIELIELNKIIGITGYISVENYHEMAEIAYITSPLHSGKGYMIEANNLVLQHGFSILEMNRIQAKAEVDNVGSQKVLEKLGFSKEGIYIYFLKVKGSFRSYIYYSILKNEFTEGNL